MKFEILNSSVTESNTDSICIPYYKNNDKNTDLNSANKSIDNILNDLEKRKQITSNIGAITNIYTLNKLNSKQLILVGMGDEKDLNYEKIRKASGTLGRFLNTMKNNSTSIIIPGAGNDNLEFNETANLELYHLKGKLLIFFIFLILELFFILFIYLFIKIK